RFSAWRLIFLHRKSASSGSASRSGTSIHRMTLAPIPTTGSHCFGFASSGFGFGASGCGAGSSIGKLVISSKVLSLVFSTTLGELADVPALPAEQSHDTRTHRGKLVPAIPSRSPIFFVQE